MIEKDSKNWLKKGSSPKKGRYYHRLTSGMTYALYRKKQVRFMTLTTSIKGKRLDISYDATVLIKRIRRRFPSFNYVRIITDEGNGVIHFLFTGAYIPKSWLVKNWTEIHESSIVDISFVRNGGKMVNYLVTHYLVGHAGSKCTYSRMSWSFGWLPRGSIGRWHSIVKVVKEGYFYNEFHNKYYKNKQEVPFKVILDIMVSLWNKYLYYHSFTQMTITSYPMGA